MKNDVVVLENEALYYTRRSLRVLRPWTALTIVFIFGLFLAWGPPNLAIHGVAMVPFLVLLVVYVGYRLPQFLRPKPILSVDRVGLTDHTTWAGLGRVAWNEIADIRVFTKGRFRGIELVPVDLDEFVSERAWYLRMAFVMDVWFGFPALFVPCVALDEEAEKVLERMEAFRQSGNRFQKPL
jgi:hypothetical protein